jgi:hypothetical protein
MLEIKLHNFFLNFFISLSQSHDPDNVFNMLTRDDLGFFLLIKFFLSHPLTLGWLEIEFHDFFYWLSMELS